MTINISMSGSHHIVISNGNTDIIIDIQHMPDELVDRLVIQAIDKLMNSGKI